MADATVVIGESLTFSFTIPSLGLLSASVVIDYRVHYRGPKGLRSPKVFKLDTRGFEPSGERSYVRRHSLKPVGIRPLFAGQHQIELQMDGRVVCGLDFELTR